MTELPLIFQCIALASSFFIKPLYMLLMLLAIWRLHTLKGHDLQILKYGIAVFLIGEILCSINYLFFGDESHLIDWGHGFAMVAGLGIILLGLFLFLDERMVFYSSQDKRCAFTGFCRRCRKYAPTSCGLEKLFIFFALALSTIALMPLLSPLMEMREEVLIFGKKTLYFYPASIQMFDLRIYPLAAFMLLLTSSVMLLSKKQPSIRHAKYPFVFGTGFLVFSLFRYILLYCYADQAIWRVFWEEFTEFLLIAGILVFLSTFAEQIKKYSAHASK